ncbi:MAG: type II toxin-antitoxin system RelE/ParE family toxin, partial [Candidatus Melainabacteria bacterium]|nr:type II toxin-antitoxin system RelE/ParE family toxin [Candidatus Melainabacteria bacterium]
HFMSSKRVIFLKNTRRLIREFPEEARRDAGAQIRHLQEGAVPDDWKPMPSIAAGVMEIRIHKPYEHRVIYVVKFQEAIYIIHAFDKKTDKTPVHDTQVAKRTYSYLLRIRQEQQV